VYDRWAPIGLRQRTTDRQGGLGRSRAYETPTQRKIRDPNEAEQALEMELDRYRGGGLAQRTEKLEKPKWRCAKKAGGFQDLFKQMVVQTVLDLKIQKKETPVWYVEPCAGEGEYHVKRLRSEEEFEGGRHPLPWPRLESLYEVLKDKDLDGMPPEIRSWMEAVRLMNDDSDDFVTKGLHAESEVDGIQWLPSTLHVALNLLREQDPVTVFEDNPVSYTALVNYVRNFSPRFKAHTEVVHLEGFKSLYHRFFTKNKNSTSKAHGKLDGQRGLVVIDPDWRRGCTAKQIERNVVDADKHWQAATVMVMYPLTPRTEHKARKLNKKIREMKPNLDLLTAELYVNNPRWTPYLSDEDKEHIPRWHGTGVLISKPPFTTAERIRAALAAMCQELSKMPGASEMRVTVEKLM
jgi:23S rRNA A2030 N6-methylase RlmJ